MTSGVSPTGSVNGPVFREFEIDPSLNGPPLDMPTSVTAFAHRALRELKENPRAVLESMQPFFIVGFGVSALATATQVMPFNIVTAPPIIASGICLVINMAVEELKKQAGDEESSTVTIEGVTAYTRTGLERHTTGKVKNVVQDQWLERVENLNTNPAKLDERVFKEAIDKGEIPEIFTDAIYLTTIETPVAFTGDLSNHIFDLDALNVLKKDANERKVQLMHPLTRQPLDFSKLVYLPNVKEQIEEAKKHVKD